MAKGTSQKSTHSAYSYKEPLHEKPYFLYAIALLSIVALAVGIFALNGVNGLNKKLFPEAIDVGDFLSKLTSHEETKALAGATPLNIIEINNDNLANLQSQIGSSLDASYIGDFIVQYTGAIVIYDYNNDEVKDIVVLNQQSQLSTDLFNKLSKHPEVQGLENEQPAGGQLGESSLAQLQQQFPEVYANAKVGDYLLRYSSKLVIYDYNNDAVINAVSLG